MRGGRQIGITHAKIDDVFAAVPRLHFETVDDGKDIGRQPFYTLKFHSLSLSETQGTTVIYKPSSSGLQLGPVTFKPLNQSSEGTDGSPNCLNGLNVLNDLNQVGLADGSELKPLAPAMIEHLA